MKGLDFFTAIYRNGVDLPVRIWADGDMPINFYRPDMICFCNLAVEEGDKFNSESFSLLEGMSVSIISKSLDERVRELTKLIIAGRPKHLLVCDGENLLSWAAHRGWK